MRRHQQLTCAVLVLSIIALAYSIFAPTHTVAASPEAAPVTAVPLYRFLQPMTSSKSETVSGFYLYTADPDERSVLIGKGWIEQQQEGYVFRQQVPGTVPLYRVVAGGEFSLHFYYTINPAEVDKATSEGWKMQGPACFVSPTQVAGTVPLYRLTKPMPGEAEANVSTAQFYTIDAKQKYEAIYSGYQLIRAEGYVWTQPVTLGASPKPPAPAPLPESYYTEELFNLGCSKGPDGAISCPSKLGYFECEYDRKKGNIKASACKPNFDLASFGKIEANLVSLGCTRFLGRPGEYICESWDGGEACDAAVKTSNGLITKCYTPRTNLISSYQNSFGREPTAKETDYWSGEIKTKKLTYKDVMKVHHQWLKTGSARGELKGMVNRSYYEVIGRYPTTDEINYWIDNRITPEGMNYEELRSAQIKWMVANDTELREMIKRAFIAAKLVTNETQIQEWVVKAKTQKLTFKRLLAMIKPGEFPKGAGKQP